MLGYLAEPHPDLGERLASDPLFAFVVSAVGLSALVALGVLWLTLRAFWEHRIDRQRDAFWRELGQDLVRIVGDPEAEVAWLARARRHRPDVLRSCLNAYLIRTAGDYKDNVARLYRTLGLLDGDLRALRSRRWSVRMRTLRRVASVVTPAERAPIAALAHEGGEVRLLVAQIIGRVGTAADALPLLQTWSVTSRLSEYPVHVMLSAFGPEGLTALLAHWSALEGRPAIQRILMDAAAKVAPAACTALLPSASRHPSLEVRIAAARACGAITGADTFAILLVLARDPTWEVRAQAATALGQHGSVAALDPLAAALGDTSFWVRQNAATALGRLGATGIARLQHELAHAPDRYARDAAAHVLTELGLLAAAEVAA